MLLTAHHQSHAVGLHAHTPRFVDGCRATVELPRHPQGSDARQQSRHQKWQPNHRQFGTQPPAGFDNGGLRYGVIHLFRPCASAQAKGHR